MSSHATQSDSSRAGRRPGPIASQGTSMMEVLVSMVVMAFGILGLASMQLVAINSNENASERSEAVLLAYSILDSMRVNAEVAKSGGYNSGPTSICSIPTGSSLAVSDLARWMKELKESLGASACAVIICNATSCTAKVQWNSSIDNNVADVTISTKL